MRMRATFDINNFSSSCMTFSGSLRAMLTIIL